MAEFFEHIARAGERWDEIAFNYYGNARLMHIILQANPDLLSPSPAPLQLRAGTRVIVPVLPEQTEAVPLPPWRQ